MANKRVVQGAFVPLGFQTLTLNNSTAVALNSTVRGVNREARRLDISIEDVAARYRADGQNPTNSTGVLLPIGSAAMTGYNGTSTIKFARSGGSGTSRVSIQSYKYVGD